MTAGLNELSQPYFDKKVSFGKKRNVLDLSQMSALLSSIHPSLWLEIILISLQIKELRIESLCPICTSESSPDLPG